MEGARERGKEEGKERLYFRYVLDTLLKYFGYVLNFKYAFIILDAICCIFLETCDPCRSHLNFLDKYSRAMSQRVVSTVAMPCS